MNGFGADFRKPFALAMTESVTTTEAVARLSAVFSFREDSCLSTMTFGEKKAERAASTVRLHQDFILSFSRRMIQTFQVHRNTFPSIHRLKAAFAAAMAADRLC